MCDLGILLVWMVAAPLGALLRIVMVSNWPTAHEGTRYWRGVVGWLTAAALLLAGLCAASIYLGFSGWVSLALGVVSFSLLLYSGRISHELIAWLEDEQKRREDPMGAKEALAEQQASQQAFEPGAADGALVLGCAPFFVPLRTYIWLFYPATTPEAQRLKRSIVLGTGLGLLVIVGSMAAPFMPAPWTIPFYVTPVGFAVGYAILVYVGYVQARVDSERVAAENATKFPPSSP